MRAEPANEPARNRDEPGIAADRCLIASRLAQLRHPQQVKGTRSAYLDLKYTAQVGIHERTFRNELLRGRQSRENFVMR